jgi:predicted outer membrane repeat protein
MKTFSNLRLLVVPTAALLALAAFVLLAQASPIGGGTTRHVSPSGSDSGTCTNQFSPCKTIDYARTQANSGDTIQLATGTYNENVILGFDLDITGAGRDKTFIDGTGLTGSVIFVTSDTTSTISSLTIQNGAATSQNLHGGGMGNSGTTEIIDVTFKHNFASVDGGAIYNDSLLTIRSTEFYSNTSADNVAGIMNHGTVEIFDSVFYENASYGIGPFGTGVHNNAGASMRLTNVTFGDNGAGYAVSTSGPMTMTNVTIAANQAGISNYGTIWSKNSIVADNQIGDCIGTGSLVSQGYNIELGNSCGFSHGSDMVNTNPVLLPLDNYGGDTLTQALPGHSPAVDAGSDCPTKDQRGVDRPQGPQCDIGAYERENIIFIPIAVRP